MTNRQKEIIDASIELIAEKGIQGLTIKNLAHKIKVTEPAIYRHFESKTEILMTMLNNLDEFTSKFTDEVLHKNIPPLSKLEEIFKCYFTIFAEHPYWVAVIFADEIFKNEELLAKRIQNLLEKKENVFMRIISEAQKEGSIRKDINKKHIAILFMGSLRLIIKKWELSGFAFDLLKEGKKLVKTLSIIIKS